MDKFINQIIQGDCLDVMKELPDKCVDLVLTDPPYGLGESNLKWEEKHYKRISEKWDSFVPVEWFTEAFRVLRNGGTFLCFGVWKTFEDVLNASNSAGFTRRDVIVWNKVNTMPNITKRGYQYTHEFIYYGTKGNKYTWQPQEQVRDIFNITWSESNTKRIHPSQKPEALMERLLKIHSKPSDLVLDPFLGSGTTAIACGQLGRKWIGIEKEPKYCEIARERIKQADKTSLLFVM